MKTDTAGTWPIATLATGQFTLIGLPQRLGNGQLPTRENYDLFLPLEAVAGENWFAQVLAVLLPRTFAWAWWTPSRTAGLKQLAPSTMPAIIPLESLCQVMGRRWFWRGMTLLIVPPTRTDAQSLLLDWAGIDTEHTPEFVLAAPLSETWDSRAISAWCRDRAAWGNPETVATLPTERTIVLFDGDIYCALPANCAKAVLQEVHNLAARWNLRVIPGPMELAWPTQRV